MVVPSSVWPWASAMCARAQTVKFSQPITGRVKVMRDYHVEIVRT